METHNNSVNVHTLANQEIGKAITASAFLPMPLAAPKLVASCTSCNCICPDGPDHCTWYASNMIGLAIGAQLNHHDRLVAQKAEVTAAITHCIDVTTEKTEVRVENTESQLTELRAKLVDIDQSISFCDEHLAKLRRMGNSDLSLSILPSNIHPQDLERWTWHKESVELFEEVIQWPTIGLLCYTPNSRYEEEGIRYLDTEPGAWTEFYSKNGVVRYYFYRSLAGEVWEVGFFRGVFNSAHKTTR